MSIPTRSPRDEQRAYSGIDSTADQVRDKLSRGDIATKIANKGEKTMRSAIRPLVLTVALSAASVAYAAPGQSLVDLEARWSHAYVAEDIPAIQSMMAADWSMQNDGGHLITKPEVVADVKSGKLAITMMNNHDVHARVMGDIGVVQGSDTETSSYAGKDTSGNYTWTDVFQKRDGRWVAIASQVTKVK